MNVYITYNKQRTRKDGRIPVYVVVSRASHPRLRIPSGLYCTKPLIDGMFQKSESNSKAKTKRLETIIEEIELVVLENPLKQNNELRELIMSKVFNRMSSTVMSLEELFEAFLKNRKHKGNGYKIYNSTLKTVLKYNPYVGIDMSKQWVDGFIKHMETIYNENTIATKNANMKTVFKWAVKNGYCRNNPFESIGVKRVETRKRSLPLSKLRELRDMQLKGRREEYRDIFMLMFYLIGINTVDLLGATKDQVVNGRLEYRRSKTQKLYSVKIQPEAQVILDRYAGEKKLLRVAEGQDYELYSARMAKTLTNIMKGGTAYWSRHSWASIASSIDIPIETISSALGHSHGSKTTLVYVNFDQTKVDEANRKVIDELNKE